MEERLELDQGHVSAIPCQLSWHSPLSGQTLGHTWGHWSPSAWICKIPGSAGFGKTAEGEAGEVEAASLPAWVLISPPCAGRRLWASHQCVPEGHGSAHQCHRPAGGCGHAARGLGHPVRHAEQVRVWGFGCTQPAPPRGTLFLSRPAHSMATTSKHPLGGDVTSQPKVSSPAKPPP